MATLLGRASGSKVGKYERGASIPSLATALAYEAALHVPVRELFAGMFDAIEARVEVAARKVAREMEAEARESSRRPGDSRSALDSRSL